MARVGSEMKAEGLGRWERSATWAVDVCGGEVIGEGEAEERSGSLPLAGLRSCFEAPFGIILD